MRSQRTGFSLIEIIIAVGVVGVLSAAIIPYLNQSLHKSRASRAYTELETQHNAIIALYSDTLRTPYHFDCEGNAAENNLDGDEDEATNASPRVLVSLSDGMQGENAWDAGGLNHTDSPFPFSLVGDMDTHLGESPCTTDNAYYDQPNLGFFWKGPYLKPGNTRDPWGNSYVVLIPQTTLGSPDVFSLSSERPGWILSAGNDTGIVASRFNGFEVFYSLDDLGMPIIAR